MIFPQKQMKIEQEASIYLKKQALQLIISLYLTRKKDEDIQFLKNNFRTTEELTNGIRSSILYGLSEQNIEMNRITYGQNQKKLSQKCISFQECIQKQFVNIFIIISFFCLISSLIYGQLANNKQIASSAIILIIAQFLIILTRISIKLYWSYLFEKTSLQKTKNNLYQVIRNGKPIQIMQSEIVVGDIIQLGFHEKVPATGIMISNKQVFLKQNQTQQKSSLKINLQSCLSKIQNMSMLDLKLNFQNSSLPSPIVLRGSQLLKGSQYSILVISVSQENLLKQFKIHRVDEFSSQKYDCWMAKLVKNWRYTSIYLICISVILLLLNKIADIKLYHEPINKSTQIFFYLLLQISVLIIVLDVNQISSFLEVIFIKMMNQLKVVSNFENLLTLKRILINQRKIVQCDQIFVKQLALCDKPDLITISEIKKLTDPTIKIIKEVQNLFDLKISNQLKSQKMKPNRIIHINKKKTKIISIYSQSKTYHNNFNQVFKQIVNLTENASSNKHKSNQHKTILPKRKQSQKQKFGSFHFLKIPQLRGSIKQQQNLKQIIHSRCRIKSKSVIDGLVGIAQNGLRTYYFQVFDMKIIDQINFIIEKGKTILFSQDHKQKMVILSRKMSVVYNLTPIMIAFNQGSYNEKPARTLVCILGVTISPKYDIINKLNKLEQNGIKPLIFIGTNHEKQPKQTQQNNIQLQYFNRRYPNQKQKYKICQASQIKNILNRLVCRKCRISNCNCTQKIQQVANIQPFISISSNIKIIYNTTDQCLRYIENAYKQIQNCLLCINSINPSTPDIIDSIFTCINFVECLKRSVVLFYAVSIAYFLVPFFYWTRDIEIISPLQIGLSYILLIFFMFLCLICQIKTTHYNPPQSSQQQQSKQIKIINKQTKINLYIITTLILLTSWLFYYLHNFIPQYQDHYDTILKLHQLDLSICKYGINNSITIQFNIQYCQTYQFGLQYSRISTIVNTYIYVVLWMFIVIVHQNLLSIRAVIVYILSICMYIVIVQLLPWMIHSYSEGLHWQHYVIIYISAAVTITIGYIISYLVCKLSIVQYFAEQIQNKISFDDENKSQYIQYLKKYETYKKLELYK